MKKKIAILLIISSLSLYANEVEDLKFGYRLYETKQFDLAADKLEEYVKKYPSSKSYNTAINLLAVNYYGLKEYKKAKDNFKKLMLSEFKDEASYFLVLIAIKEENELDASINLKNISSDKLKVKATYQLANYFFKKNKLEQAEELFLKITNSEDQFSKEALLKLGIIYFKTEKPIKTTAMLISYLDRKKDNLTDPNLALVYYILASTEEQLDASTEAMNYYEKVIQDFPQSEYASKSLYSLSKLYYRIGMLAESEKTAVLLLETDYKKEAYALISEIAYDNKNYFKAEENYKKQLEFLTENKEIEKVKYKIVLSLIKQNKYDEALKKLKDLKDTAYKSEYYYYTAFILFTQKEYGSINTLNEEILKSEINKEYKEDLLTILGDSSYALENYKEASVLYLKLYEVNKNEKNFYKYYVSLSKFSNADVLYPLFQEYTAKYGNGKNRRDIYLIMGNSLADKGQLDESEKIYKRYLEIENDEVFLKNLSSILLRNKKYEDLIIYLERRADSNEKNYLFGLANQGLSKYKQSLFYYEKILNGSLEEYKEESYLRIMDSLLTLESYDKIIKLSSEYLENEMYIKYRTKILDKKAIAYFKQKKYKDSALVFRSLSEYPELKDYTYFMRGEIYYNEENLELAKQYYEKVILEFKESEYKMVSLYWLIKITYQEKEYDSSLSYINFFLKNYEKTDFVEDVLYYLGNIYIIKNETELALQEYEKVINITKNEDLKVNLLKTVIDLYFRSQKYTEALKWAEEITNENDKEIWKARIYEKQGEYEKAISIYKGLSNNEKIGDEVNYYLGNYYLEQKNYTSSREYFNRVLEFNLSEFKDDALFGIGLSYEEEAAYKKALTAFMRIKLLYEASNLQDISNIKIAENYEKLGNKDEALKTYIDFVNKFSTSGYYKLIIERLLAIYWNDGKKEEALSYYKKLQNLDLEKSKEYDQYFSTGGN